MKIKINFHSSLRKYTKVDSHTVVCKDFTDIVSALTFLFPDLGRYINHIKNEKVTENLLLLDMNKKLIDKRIIEFNRLRDEHKEVYLVPMLAGGKGKSGFFLAAAFAVALIALPAIAPSLAGTSLFGSATIGSIARSIGINLLLSGIQGLFTQKPPKPPERQTPDAQERIDNNIFEGLQNTTSSDNNIPLTYGRTRVAGQVISGYILTRNHGKNDNVRVSEAF